MLRYLAFVWDPGNHDSNRAVHALIARVSSSSEWSLQHYGEGLAVAYAIRTDAVSQAYRLAQNSGVVLGQLFSKSADGQQLAQATDFSGTESRKIVESGGHHLVDQYWGTYFATFRNGLNNRFYILRDPMGSLPCFMTSYRGISVFFSHFDDCARLVPVAFSINRNYIIASFVERRLLNRESGLNEVSEVMPGERIEFADGASKAEFLWSPAEICRGERLEDEKQAADALRTTVQSTVNAWASKYRNVIQLLAGGLDSSIISGCLAQSPCAPEITCLNFFINIKAAERHVSLSFLDKRRAAQVAGVMGYADERRFARLVAERWGYPTVEEERLVSNIDLAKITDAPLSPRPSGFVYCIDTDRIELEVAQRVGAQAYFTGRGGDNVFYNAISTLPAADYVYSHGFGRRLLEIAANTAKRTRDSLWTVLSEAFAHGIIGRKPTLFGHSLDRANLLRDGICDVVSVDYLSHPWADLWNDLPPGKRQHARGLIGCFHYAEAYERAQHVDTINPLHSQPVVELCLRIPTYVLNANGQGRGLARQAFADLLPPEIKRRQTKGAGGPFIQKLIKDNTPFLREYLLDGFSVKEGFLDRQKLEDYLVADQPFVQVPAMDILDYFAIEGWLRDISDLRHRAAA